jgi:hypothetical protein
MERLTHESPRQSQFRRDCEDAGLNIVKFKLLDGNETYAVKCGPGGPEAQDVIESTKIKLNKACTDGESWMDGEVILYVGVATR